MPVLWPVISSLHAPRSRMSRIAAASGALYMLLVRSREQQAAESPMTSTCIHHITSLLGQLLSAVTVCAK